MRMNLPVTQRAYDFPPDQTLISITDTKGRITYCNANFIDVSGFELSELLGQSHNIVRHPDIPAEAFRDLWATIQSGLPWTAVIKNRRKNGDYYWVRANVTPVRDGDNTIGFLSVRTHATDTEVAAADRLFATMRQEADKQRLIHTLHHGRVVRRTLLGRLAHWLRPGLKGQTLLLFLITAALPLLVLALNTPLWAGLITGALAAAVATALVSRLLLSPLRQVVATANLMAGGDLSCQVHVTGRDEIAQLQLALAQLNVSMRTVVRDVRHEVINLLDGAKDIADGNQHLSSRTEDQASSLEETAATMAQIHSTIQQTSHLAQQGAQHATLTTEAVARGNDAVQGVVDTMQDIQEATQRIQEIIHVIEGVAFQTNILALNAAVEAARAGEQGRGFAVVAAEVRALSLRTTDAAKEVRTLIENAGTQVAEGNQRTADALSRMQEVTQAVGEVSTMLAQISLASQEQATGVGQVNDAVAALDTITHHNAGMVQNLAAAAHALNQQVVLVHNTIRVFRLANTDVSLADTDAVTLRRQHRPQAAPKPSYAPAAPLSGRATPLAAPVG